MKQIDSSIFYFIRHGQTDANKQELMCGGDGDVPLNEVGRSQAMVASSESKELLESIEVIYVSPMKRTRETAELLFEGLNKEFEFIEGLREWRVGDWESKHRSEVPNPFNSTEDPPNGETRQQFEERVINTISDLVKASDGKKILIVAHGGVAHALFTYLGVDVPLIDNAVLYEVNGSEYRWELRKMSTK